MKKAIWTILLAILLTTFMLPQEAFCLAKRPRDNDNDRIVVKQTSRPPDVRDMQVATGQIPPISQEESD